MRSNRSSTRQIQYLFSLLGFCLGFFSAWSVAGFVFDSPKGFVLLSDWALPAFALICGVAGWVIPHGVMPSSYFDKKSWLYIIFIAFIEIFMLCFLSALAAVICRRIHTALIPIEKWLADGVFLMIPIITTLFTFFVGAYKKKMRK